MTARWLRVPGMLVLQFGAAAALVLLFGAGCGQMSLPEPLTPPELARPKERAPAFKLETPDGIELKAVRFRGRVLVIVAAEPDYAQDIPPWLEFVKKRYGEPAPLPQRAQRTQAAESRSPSVSSVPSVASRADGGPTPSGGYVLLAAIELPHSDAFARHQYRLPEGTGYHIALVNAARERMRGTLAELVRHAKKLRRRGARGAARAERKAEAFGERLKWVEPGFRGAFGLVGEGPHVIAVGADGSLLALVDGPASPGRSKVLSEALDEALDGTLGKAPPPSGK